MLIKAILIFLSAWQKTEYELIVKILVEDIGIGIPLEKQHVQALKNKVIGYLGLDVYEDEEQLFFKIDLIPYVFAQLQTFHNVIITGRQAFFTKEALTLRRTRWKN